MERWRPFGELDLFHPEIMAKAEIKKGTQGRNLSSTSGLLKENILLRLLGGPVGCCLKSQINSPIIWNEEGFSRSPLHQWRLVEVENDVIGWSLWWL